MNPPADAERLFEELAALRERVAQLEARLMNAPASRRESGDSISIVCFSGDWDRLFAAFTIANGALALGQEVHMFFTFWGATALRKQSVWSSLHRNWLQNLMGLLLPSDVSKVPLSKMHFSGIGKWLIGILMRQKGVEDLPALMEHARDLGAKFYCCDTSLELFGWKKEDLVGGDSLRWCGVSTFLSEALKGRITLFI